MRFNLHTYLYICVHNVYACISKARTYDHIPILFIVYIFIYIYYAFHISVYIYIILIALYVYPYIILFIYICIFTCLIVNTQWREKYILSIYIYIYIYIYFYLFNLSILSGSWSPTDRWPWCFVPFWRFSCFTGVVWVGWVGWVGGGVAITYSHCALRGHARTWVLFYTQWRRANVSDTRENKIVSAEPNWRNEFK